jgi:hypothetical protein
MRPQPPNPEVKEALTSGYKLSSLRDGVVPAESRSIPPGCFPPRVKPEVCQLVTRGFYPWKGGKRKASRRDASHILSVNLELTDKQINVIKFKIYCDIIHKAGNNERTDERN